MLHAPEQIMDAKQTELLLRLEKRLLDPEIRKTADQVSALLADDFFEIGASGRTFDKQAILNELADEKLPSDFTITDFRAIHLCIDLAQTRYRIVENGTLRTSLWRFTDGEWRMIFHQGTRPDATRKK